MSQGHCSCPECRTKLRIRDRTFVGRKIECPECHVELLIRQNEAREYFAERPKVEPKQVPKEPKSSRAKIPSAWQRRIAEFASSPLTISWALAAAVTLFVAVIMLRPNVRLRPKTDISSQQPAQSETTSNPDHKPELDQAAVAEKTAEPNAPDTNNSDPPPEPNAALHSPTASADVPLSAKVDYVEADVPSALKPDRGPLPVVLPVKIDVKGKLEQPLNGYKTPMPVKREALIEELAEMLGAEIDRKEIGERELQRTVTITLDRKTTVGEVLKALIDSANWEYIIEDTGLRLRPRQDTRPAS